MIVKINIKEELQDKLNKKLIKQPLEEYINFLVEKNLTSFYPVSNGYYVDTYSKKLFDKKNKEVLLTKTQYKIIEVLAKNKNTIVSVDDMIKYAWSNNKPVSIYTFRNMIKQIRDKTYYEFIKNHSNRGYEITV